MPNKSIKIIMLVIVMIFVIAIAIVLTKPHWLSSSHRSKAQSVVTIKTDNQPTLGAKDAPLQIISFEDFKCMNCRLFDLQILPWIVQNYVDTKQANYTAITVSFLPDSMQAAVAARCIYQQKPSQFFVFSDLLFKKQGDEMTNWANTAKLLEWANQIKGIDQEQFTKCLFNPDTVQQIIKNTQYGMTIMGGSLSTPALYINGVLVRPLTKKHIQEVIHSLGKT